MRKLLAIAGALTLATGLAFGMAGSPNAAPASVNALHALQQTLPTSMAKRASCDGYGYHCHKKCWEDYYGKTRCKKWCHSC